MVEYGRTFSGGDVTIPSSKSIAHRAIMCAALSKGGSMIYNVNNSNDIQAALNAVKSIGCFVDYDEHGGSIFIDSTKAGEIKKGTIDCIESGNTLRFITPIAAALGGEWTLTGSGRLPQRPMSVYRDLFPTHGVSYETSTENELPLNISGKLTAGIYSLPGNISSQFVSGLLMALPVLEGDSEIILTSPLESAAYVDMTIDVLDKFGIKIKKTESGYRVSGGQSYTPRSYAVEGDWSHAAFFLSMAALDPNGAGIRLNGLNKYSVQGDMACIEQFGRLGLKTEWDGNVLKAWNPNAEKPYGGLHGCEIDVSQIPDMLPALSVCAALSEGETRFVNAARLRLKESDRLSAMEDAINALGGKAKAREDELIIEGVPCLKGGTAQGRNDHRVVMALAAAGLRSEDKVCVTDETGINKTYPTFFEDFIKLGGSANVVNMG